MASDLSEGLGSPKEECSCLRLGMGHCDLLMMGDTPNPPAGFTYKGVVVGHEYRKVEDVHVQ